MGSIRDVFPENLKQLMRSYSNVSEFSRAIDIDRNKINRYLSGLSSPQPEELKKICDHFGVTADILLIPIANGESATAKQNVLHDVVAEQISKRNFEIEVERLPSGLYQGWKNSVAKPGMVVCYMARIYRQGNATLLRMYDPWSAYGYDDAFKTRHSREITGVLFGQPLGFFQICFSKNVVYLTTTFHHFGHKNNDRIYPGRYMTQSVTNTDVATGGVFMEYLGNNTSRILAAARQRGYHEFDDVPLHVQHLLIPPRQKSVGRI